MAEEARDRVLNDALIVGEVTDDRRRRRFRRDHRPVSEVALAEARHLQAGVDAVTFTITELRPADRIVVDLTDALHSPVIEIDFSAVREVGTIDLEPLGDGPSTGVSVADEAVIDLRPFVGIAETPTADETSTDVPFSNPHLGVMQQGLAAAAPSSLMVKRFMDLVLASFMLILLSPVLIGIALLVAMTSAGPVLYRSERVGKDGSVFTFLKFRSMYLDAPARLEELRVHNEQTGPVFKMSNDPRVTPVGRFIRRASLDELPQLVHVLSGTMSIVGPRPALVEEVEQYDAYTRQRLLVSPGITCIWQVSGRSTVDFETWVDMDLEYIRTWTPLKDLELVARPSLPFSPVAAPTDRGVRSSILPLHASLWGGSHSVPMTD